jgi:ATP-dependent protease ClpP protease subunit
MKRYAYAAWIGWTFAAAVAFAQDTTTAVKPVAGPRVVGIGFRGSIKPSDVDRLRQAIALAGEERIPARLIVFFDSGGGDGLAAMQIGRMLRYAKAHVFVTKRCASACIFAYVGGVYRDALPGTLGIHRGRVTATVEQGRVVDVDPGASPVAKMFLSDAEAQMQDHLLEMGMPTPLFDAMQAVSAKSMRWLTTDEAAELGLTGFDPEYLAERAKEMQTRYGIPEGEYVRRSRTVLSHCADLAGQHAAFIACYRKQLLSPPQ